MKGEMKTKTKKGDEKNVCVCVFVCLYVSLKKKM